MNSKRASQTESIQADLLAGRQVNSIVVFPRGITRLSSIIERLRTRGWPIHTDRRENNGLADYSLPEGWRPPETKKPRQV